MQDVCHTCIWHTAIHVHTCLAYVHTASDHALSLAAQASVQCHCHFLAFMHSARTSGQGVHLCAVQGVMSISEAMMIPAQLNPLLGPAPAGRAQQMNMPSHVPTTNRMEGWTSSNWPASLGRATGLSMGTSPFGRSVDMVDMATQLMEAGAGERNSHLSTEP